MWRRTRETHLEYSRGASSRCMYSFIIAAWKNHGAHVSESCCTYTWVMSSSRTSHVLFFLASRAIFSWRLLKMYMHKSLFFHSLCFDIIWSWGNARMQFSFLDADIHPDLSISTMFRSHILLSSFVLILFSYEGATICRLPDNIGLFCKRALQKRLNSVKKDRSYFFLSSFVFMLCSYEVARIIRLPKNIGLFCKRAL